MKNRNNKNDGVHPQTPSSPSCFFRCHCLHCPEVLSSTVLAPGQSQPLYLCLRAHPFSPIQSYHSSYFPLSFINISFFWIIPISMLLFLPSEKKKNLSTSLHLSVTITFISFISFSYTKQLPMAIPSLQFLSFHFFVTPFPGRILPLQFYQRCFCQDSMPSVLLSPRAVFSPHPV